MRAKLITVFVIIGTVFSSAPSELRAAKQPQPQPVSIYYLSPAAISEGSDLVARVRVSKVEILKKQSTVYTRAVCNVLSTWKGNLSSDSLIVEHAGGRKGNVVTRAGPMPDWQVDREWILGVNKTDDNCFTVRGLKQGAFRIKGEKAVRNFSGFVFADAPPDRVGADKIETFAVEELKSRMGQKASAEGRGDNLLAEAKAKGGKAEEKDSPSESGSTQRSGRQKTAQQVEKKKSDSGTATENDAKNSIPMENKVLFFAVFGILFIVNLLLIIRNRRQ